MRRIHLPHIFFLLACFALLPSSISRSQGINPDLLHERWKAQWIRTPEAPRREFGVYYFRKTFVLDTVPSRFVIHVSADNRYELFVNGTRVAAGPARGDLDHWRFETLFVTTGIGNGSTYRMIPSIFREQKLRELKASGEAAKAASRARNSSIRANTAARLANWRFST